MHIAAQIINTVLFLAISGLHFYWAIGSFWGKKMKSSSSVIPEVEGKPLFTPSTFSTLVVAIGLLIMAKVSAHGLGIGFDFKAFGPYVGYGNLAISIIFLIRAIGDFRYVGFFKFMGKHNESKFAKNDTKYYSPLCLLIAVLAFIVFWGE